jgi:hypothetical protein
MYGRGFGAALGNATDYVGDGGVDEPAGPVYDDAGQVYQTRVDANGDGRWDQFSTIDRGGQGVDLAVDRNHDGRIDWVGHDLDRDGLIDEASVDHDNDGTLETRWVDGNGDGWLDSRLPAQPPPAGAAGAAGAGGAAGGPTPDGPEAQRGYITDEPPQYDSQRGYIRPGGDQR